jgi:hypothetical protein
LDAANKNLANIQQTYEHALEQQETLNVYAPISGTISDINSQVKPSGKVTGSTRLCTISDTSSYRLVVQIPEDQRDRASVDQEVRLTFPTIEGLAITSQISSLDEDDEGVLFATVFIEEPDERITKGIAVEASIILKSIPSTYIVPSAALRTSQNGGSYLELLLDPSRGIVTNIPVTVLANDGTKAAVQADNIQADTSVVISSTPVNAEEKPDQK